MERSARRCATKQIAYVQLWLDIAQEELVKRLDIQDASFDVSEYGPEVVQRLRHAQRKLEGRLQIE